jgi:hypothetical protein
MPHRLAIPEDLRRAPGGAMLTIRVPTGSWNVVGTTRVRGGFGVGNI